MRAQILDQINQPGQMSYIGDQVYIGKMEVSMLSWENFSTRWMSLLVIWYEIVPFLVNEWYKFFITKYLDQLPIEHRNPTH